jgi:hypothetical protein
MTADIVFVVGFLLSPFIASWFVYGRPWRFPFLGGR